VILFLTDHRCFERIDGLRVADLGAAPRRDPAEPT
jgi:hypothetical protein